MLEAKDFVSVHFAASFTPFVISLMRARALESQPAASYIYAGGSAVKQPHNCYNLFGTAL